MIYTRFLSASVQTWSGRRGVCRWKIAAVAILLSCVGVVSVGCDESKEPSTPDSASTQEAIRIGVVLSLTGRGGTYGQRAHRGMQIAKQMLDADPDFEDTRVQLIVEDSGSAAVQAVSAFKKLVEVDRVSVVVGLILSDEVLACAPIANEREVVLLTPGAGSDAIKDAGDYVFRTRESGRLQAEAIARACVERLGIHDVGIMHSNSANGISYRDAFLAAVEELGGRVVRAVAYNEGKPDYRGEVQQMRSANPAAVYLAGLDTEMGLILKQSRELGFTPQFLASAGGISPKLLEIAGSAAEGMICGGAAFDPESEDPQVRAFVDAYTTRFNEQPDWLAANAFDAVRLIADLLREGLRTGPPIRTALYGMDKYEAVVGVIEFDSNGEVIKPIALVVVRNGRFEPFAGP